MTTSSSRPRTNSRDQVLVAHAVEMIARTSFSQDRFAQALAAELHAQIPEKATAERVPDFERLQQEGNAEGYLKAAGSWLRRVSRYLAGENDLPSWIEEGWVQALAPEYRERCINELAARHGLIGAREAGTEGCALTAFGQLVGRLGDVVEHAGAVLADGKIDEADLPLLPEAIRSLAAVEARAHEMRLRMQRVLDECQAAPGGLRAVK